MVLLYKWRESAVTIGLFTRRAHIHVLMCRVNIGINQINILSFFVRHLLVFTLCFFNDRNTRGTSVHRNEVVANVSRNCR